MHGVVSWRLIAMLSMHQCFARAEHCQCIHLGDREPTVVWKPQHRRGGSSPHQGRRAPFRRGFCLFAGRPTAGTYFEDDKQLWRTDDSSNTPRDIQVRSIWRVYVCAPACARLCVCVLICVCVCALICC